MSWCELKRGVWTELAPEDRLDPYLLWADATNFVDFRLDQSRSEEKLLKSFVSRAYVVPVLIKLRCAAPKDLPRGLAAWKRLKKLEPMLTDLQNALLNVSVQPGSRFITAQINHKFLALLATYPLLHGLVQRVELCLPVRPARTRQQVVLWKPNDSSDSCPSVVIGAIDDGCPFVRAGMRQSSTSTRVSAIWDQSEEPAFVHPRRPA